MNFLQLPVIVPILATLVIATQLLLSDERPNSDHGETKGQPARQPDGDNPLIALPNHRTSEVLGWTLHLNNNLLTDERKATARMLDILAVQLQRVIDIVPQTALKHLRKVPLWVNPPYEGYRPSAEYHPEGEWLKENGRDPVMAKAVEITNTANFPFENRRMPYLLLHELAHAYHDRVLGFDDPEIIAAYEKAKASGSYDAVERFTGEKISTDKAYAMSNHKEYFAETTEAFFGKNDFYPFNREELKKHDPQMFELLPGKWARQN